MAYNYAISKKVRLSFLTALVKGFLRSYSDSLFLGLFIGFLLASLMDSCVFSLMVYKARPFTRLACDGFALGFLLKLLDGL